MHSRSVDYLWEMSTSMKWNPAKTPAWAASLGCSERAVELLRTSHFIDLHADIEVPVRLFGYRPGRRHRVPRRIRPLVGHLDFVRVREASLTGVVYDVATNPFRSARRRLEVTLQNLDGAVERITSVPSEQALALDRAGYDVIVDSGRTAYWLAIQGGNAFSADPTTLDGPVGRQLHRVTLVHLTNSDLGGTSSPRGGNRGLSPLGATVIEALEANRILLDLAHASKRTFWDALDVHATDVPPIVSHTGVAGVHDHWRNVDDDQIRAVADRGGAIGIMYQSSFLAPVRWACERRAIVDHLEHLIAIGGEGIAAIGTDYDGFIVPPRDLLDVTHHPLLVQDMIDRGWSERRIRGVLGENYLRVVEAVRPGAEDAD